MNPRGRLLGVGAYVRGKRWRACLRQIDANHPGDIERRSLSKLLNHALAHVPYYHDLGVSEPQIDAFPLLSRATLRTQYERLKSDDLEGRPFIQVSTGGSTGEPVWAILEREFQDWERATEIYAARTLYGMPPLNYLGSRRVIVWHRRRMQRNTNALLRLVWKMLGQVIYIEPYEILTEAKLDEHLERINGHRPDVIVAYAGTLFEIAKHAQRRRVRMHRPRFIIASVEMLFPAMRATIQAVFQCHVHNSYGAAETGRIAAECRQGKLHVFSFGQHVEVLDADNRPTRAGSVGRVVVTPLHNLAMPLIRYDIGDLARVSAEPCDCGSALPAWDEISGRVVHHFVRPDGSIVRGGNFIAMFYEYDWVMRFRVLQEDIDKIVVSYTRVPGHNVPTRDIEKMTQAVRKVMGQSCSVIWEEVDAIPNSPSGKHLYVRSLVWEARAGSTATGDDKERTSEPRLNEG